MLLCPNQPLPTNKPGRERQSMCYDEKMEWTTLHTALTTLPVKKQTKQNWPQAICQLVQPTYQCNGNISWHHTRKCTSQEEKQKDAPTPPSEARLPRTPTTWILSNSINLHNTFYGATATQLLQDRSTPNTDTYTKTNPAAINYIVKFMRCWVHFLVHAYA